MAYGLRFRGEWLDKLGGLSRFDIEERDFVGNAEIMDMQEDPLDTERADIGDKTSVGSGCELRVTATYDGQFLGLYTKDAQKFKGKHYKDGRLIWVGYLNSEVYTEGFDRVKDYPVTLQFNDGIAVLERIKFLKSDGSRYTELMKAWDVIALIIDRLGLEFQYLYTAFDIYEKAMDTTKELLQQFKVDARNYYDEKGEPLNCREVLEAIISPFHAVCFTNEACLNIIREPLLSRDSFTRKRYALGSSIGEDQVVNPCLSIPSQADFYEMDQSIDVVAGKNKATVKYSPYGVEELYGFPPRDPDRWIGTPEWYKWNEPLFGDVLKLAGVTGYKGLILGENTTITCFTSNLTNGENLNLNDDSINYTFWCKNPYSGKYLLQSDNLINDQRVYKTGKSTIQIKVEIIPNNSSYIFTFTSGFNPSIKKIIVPMCITVDGKTYKPSTKTWEITSTESSDNWVYAELEEESSMYGRKVTIGYTLETFDIPCGLLGFKIKADMSAYKKDGNEYELLNKTGIGDENTLLYLHVVNVDGYVVNKNGIGTYPGTDQPLDGIEIDKANFDDIEFTGEINDQWINEASDIEIIHGDSKENNCTDRGGFHLLNDEFTGEWKTFRDTQYYNIAELLLRSFISNYQDSKFQLSGTVSSTNMFNGNGMNVDGILSFHSVLTYPGSTLGNKKLMFMGGTYNDKSQTISGNWVEILDDDLTINEQ